MKKPKVSELVWDAGPPYHMVLCEMERGYPTPVPTTNKLDVRKMNDDEVILQEMLKMEREYLSYQDERAQGRERVYRLINLRNGDLNG